MNLSQLTEIKDAALNAALKASDHLQSINRNDLLIEHKDDLQRSKAASIFSQADIECEIIIINSLLEITKNYHLATLSEEQASESSVKKHPRLSTEYFWAIDPLDGSLPFIEGNDGYSISIALVNKHGTALIGVVVDPCQNDYYWAIKGHGVSINDKPLIIKTLSDYQQVNWFYDRSLINKKEYTNIKKQLQNQFFKVNEINHQGAVMNAVGVLQSFKNQKSGLYLKPSQKPKGGGSIWDFAATSCILLEAGIYCSNYSGEQLRLNEPTTNFMNQQGICMGLSFKLS